ncbi:hypothetical protein OURE66S_04554 [Oligella ureolytica]
MVLECHTPEEKTRVQSFNDFIVFGTMAIGSFVSGSLLTYYNWGTVLWVSFAPLVLAVGAVNDDVTGQNKSGNRIGLGNGAFYSYYDSRGVEVLLIFS